MHDPPARLIVAKEAAYRRMIVPDRGEGLEPGAQQALPREGLVIPRDQKIEVGLPAPRGRETAPALPVAIGDAISVKAFQDGAERRMGRVPGYCWRRGLSGRTVHHRPSLPPPAPAFAPSRRGDTGVGLRA